MVYGIAAHKLGLLGEEAKRPSLIELIAKHGVKKDEGWDAFVEQIKNILLASDRDDIKQPTTGPIAETGCGGFDREMAELRKSIQAEEKEPLETWQKSKDGARGYLIDKWNATAE